MRARANDLFDLVKALSVHEHRYFSKFLREQRLKHIDELEVMFNLIKEQDTYNEAEVKESMRGTVIFKFFPQYKNQLNDLVKEAIINYHKESSLEAEIHHLLHIETILRQKGLYEQCNKILKQAADKSFRYEHHLLELEVLKRRIALLSDLFPKDYTEQLNELISKKNATILKLQNESEYRDLGQKLFFLIRKLSDVRDESVLNELDELIKDPILKNENNAFNFWSKLKFNYVHAHYNKLKKNYTATIKYRKRSVEIWQLHPHKIKETPRYYLAALFNLIGALHKVGNYKESEVWLKEVDTVDVKSDTENANIFEQTMLYEHLILINTNRLEEAIELVPKIENGFEKFNILIQNSNRLAISHNVFLTYFIMDQYKNALKWVNKIIDIEKTEERQDIQSFSKIFRLIIFYCLEDYDLLENQIRSAKRNGQKNDKLHGLETTIIKYLPKLVTTNINKSDQHEALSAFKEKLNEYSKENKGVLGLQETSLWVESKIRNITFRELLRELIEKGNKNQ